MNWKTIGFGAAAAGALYFIVKSFSDAIGMDFTGVKWLGRDGLKLKLALVYKLSNSNDIPATVSSFKGRLKYGKYDLSELAIEEGITIEPGDSQNMQVAFTVRPGMLMAELLQLFENKGGFQKFRVTGLLVGKIGNVPYATPINTQVGLAE